MNKKQQVIIRPVLSEKSLNSYRLNRVCTFIVDPKSTKAHIQKEFNQMFGVKPVGVATVVSRENRKARSRTKIVEHRKYEKKAYIKIGDNKLDIFENID